MGFGLRDVKNWLTTPGKGRWRSLVIDWLTLGLPIAVLAGGYGFLAGYNKWFPTRFYLQAVQGFEKIEEMTGRKLPWYYTKVGNLPAVEIHRRDKMAPGLTLITGLGKENHPEARIIDNRGNVVQRWSINWFKLWPDATHLPPHGRFNALPGPHTHGVIIADNGDIIFSLERAGLFRMDACGHVKWKLPRRTHHSLFKDEDRNLWVPDMIATSIRDPRLSGYDGETMDYRLLKVSPDGKILRQWRIFDLFLKNGMTSYLYLTSRDNEDAHMRGDTLHMNDAKVFPRSMPAGTFKAGDVMISLRNINMVMVFDPDSGKVKHVFNGPFIRQHDADFVDGNTISVFDNYSQTRDTLRERSRIIEVSTDGRPPRVLFEGNRQHPFFSNVMGKHQALPNGNLLLTEATRGRALEIDANGNLVWEYRNFVRDGVVGLMDEAQRLSPAMDAAFFARARAACAT